MIKSKHIAGIFIFGVVLLPAGCGHPGANSSAGQSVSDLGSGSPSGQATALPLDQSGSPLLPDPHLTPGATLDVTVQDISVPGYTQKVRNVPQSVKDQVYAEYGISHHRPGEYEVDHLISLELGGSNSIKNLWPQSYQTQPWNAHVKDTLENKLHDLVVSGQVPLTTAQHDIATDWITAYKKYLDTDAPLSGGTQTAGYSHRHRSRSTPHPLTDPTPLSDSGGSSSSSGQVWVNTRSGKYFLSGSSYYGKTKEGEYLTEAQAQQQGFVAAKGQ